MVIDSHIHLFPPEAAQDPAGWGRLHGERHWTNLMAPQGRKSLQDWPTLRRLIDDMDAAGVDRAILQGWYWENPRTCAIHNQFYLECVAAYPDRLSATASFHLDVAKDSADWLKTWLDQGMVGVGELLPQAQGLTWADPRWSEVCELVTERQTPLMFHVTEPVGREYPGKVPTPFADIEQFLRDYPEVRVVLAHWGGLFPFYALHLSLEDCLRNVWVDTSASPLLYRPEIFHQFSRLFPAEKILFGSDYPLRLYPAVQKQADMQRFLQEVRQYTPSHQLDGLLGENALGVWPLMDHFLG